MHERRVSPWGRAPSTLASKTWLIHTCPPAATGTASTVSTGKRGAKAIDAKFPEVFDPLRAAYMAAAGGMTAGQMKTWLLTKKPGRQGGECMA
jgi:hypothetical protein